MKRTLHLGCVLLLAYSVRAATEIDTVTLAVISETQNATVLADLLTAEFSKHEGIRLLERAEVERIYHEQELSASNRDDLRLGRLLGADGLLLLDFVEQEIALRENGVFTARKTQTLNARLVAVKPGVVLAAESFLGATNVTPE